MPLETPYWPIYLAAASNCSSWQSLRLGGVNFFKSTRVLCESVAIAAAVVGDSDIVRYDNADVEVKWELVNTLNKGVGNSHTQWHWQENSTNEHVTNSKLCNVQGYRLELHLYNQFTVSSSFGGFLNFEKPGNLERVRKILTGHGSRLDLARFLRFPLVS